MNFIGIPKRKSPRPDAEWAEPDYGYVCDAWPVSKSTSCLEFCGHIDNCCGDLSNYKNPNELRTYCCGKTQDALCIIS